MRKGFLLMIVLGFFILEPLALQVSAAAQDPFAKGAQLYKLAVKKRDAKDEVAEKELLRQSYNLFLNLHTNKNDKPLVMSYLVYLRLQSLQVTISSFPQSEIEEFVKTEYKVQFPTIDKIDILSLNETTRADKKLLKDELKKIAEKFLQAARILVGEARKEIEKGNYPNALDKLNASRKIWPLAETSVLMAECRRLESKTKQCLDDFNAAMAAKMYPKALNILKNQAAGVLSTEEIVIQENNVKVLWSADLYNQANDKYRKRDLTATLALIEDSMKVKYTEKAKSLWENILKRQRKFAFFMDVGGSGNFKISEMNYYKTYHIPIVAYVTNENTITGTNFKKETSFGIGFIYMFSPSSGIRASVSSIRQNWTFDTNYYFYWKWLDGTSETRRNSMSESGKGTLVLISIDYLFQKNITHDLYLNLYAGPTVHYSKVDLFTGIGFGGIWFHKLNQLYYPEWFSFKYHNNDVGLGVGGNIGGGLEYKFPPLSVFLECQYYLIPSKKRNWELINRPYVGGFGIFDVGEPLSLPNLPEYEMKINFSTFKIVAGVRIYF